MQSLDDRRLRSARAAVVKAYRTHSLFPSPRYSGPLQELAAPQGGTARVRFACPHCGEVLERLARLDETRWYLPHCSSVHSGVGVQDPGIERIRAPRA